MPRAANAVRTAVKNYIRVPSALPVVHWKLFSETFCAAVKTTAGFAPILEGAGPFMPFSRKVGPSLQQALLYS